MLFSASVAHLLRPRRGFHWAFSPGRQRAIICVSASLLGPLRPTRGLHSDPSPSAHRAYSCIRYPFAPILRPTVNFSQPSGSVHRAFAHASAFLLVRILSRLRPFFAPQGASAAHPRPVFTEPSFVYPPHRGLQQPSRPKCSPSVRSYICLPVALLHSRGFRGPFRG